MATFPALPAFPAFDTPAVVVLAAAAVAGFTAADMEEGGARATGTEGPSAHSLLVLFFEADPVEAMYI